MRRRWGGEEEERDVKRTRKRGVEREGVEMGGGGRERERRGGGTREMQKRDLGREGVERKVGGRSGGTRKGCKRERKKDRGWTERGAKVEKGMQ